MVKESEEQRGETQAAAMCLTPRKQQEKREKEDIFTSQELDDGGFQMWQ